jgi:hypothetical protein
MIRDWKSMKNDELLPRFSVRRLEPVKLEVAVKINNWAPTLQDWFMNLSDTQRETLVLKEYSKQKLKEVGASTEEIREIWGD